MYRVRPVNAGQEVQPVNPATAISPVGKIRRRGAKKWHMVSGQAGDYFSTMCSQTIRSPEEGVAYNAAEITCTDCLVGAIRRKTQEVQR